MVSIDTNTQLKTNSSELYKLLDAIKITSQDKNVNLNNINYEPSQGDYVKIRGSVRCYNNKLEINAVSCTKISSSCEELVHMVLPSILAQNVYSKINTTGVESNSPTVNDMKLGRELSPSIKKMKITNKY